MGCNALIRPSQDGVHSIEAAESVTSLAWCALVAARTVVVIEIGAASALHEVAAHRGHVPNLGRRSRNDCARQHRKALANRRVLGNRRVLRRGTYQPGSVGLLLEGARQTCDINQGGGLLDGLPHQVNEVGTTAEELGGGVRSSEPDRLGYVMCTGICERGHFTLSA